MKAELAKLDAKDTEGVRVNKAAYAWDVDQGEAVDQAKLDTLEKKRRRAEWYLVDWDERGTDGLTPHQHIMKAMAKHVRGAPANKATFFRN